MFKFCLKIESKFVILPKCWMSLGNSSNYHLQSTHHNFWIHTLVNPWCQFHQHFTRAFFVQKSFWQLFSSYVLAIKHFHTKNAHVKCWWNLHLMERNVRRKKMDKLKSTLSQFYKHFMSDFLWVYAHILRRFIKKNSINFFHVSRCLTQEINSIKILYESS